MVKKGPANSLVLTIGLGLQSSWWLFSINGAIAALDSFGSSWLGAIVIHIAYFTAQVMVLFFSSRISWVLDKSAMIVAAGAVVSALSLLAMISSMFLLSSAITVGLLFFASFFNALLYLRWMKAYAEAGRPYPSLGTLVLSMATSSVVWLLGAQVGGIAIVFIIVAVPLCASILCARFVSGAGETRVYQRGSALRILPALILVCAFFYEMAPGVISGVALANDDAGANVMAQAYIINALAMALVAVVGSTLGKDSHFSNLLYRLIVPFLSLGLLALAVFSVDKLSFAAAGTLTGSMLFEAFLLHRFALEAIRTKEDPLRVFALGGALLQLGLLCSYAVGVFLHGLATIVISGVALAVVFLMILIDAFTRDSVLKGLRVNRAKSEYAPRASEENAASGAAMHDVFAQRYELSKRESEILVLALHGKNIPAIAEELSIAQSTVKTHFKNIYHKTGVSNRQELITLFDDAAHGYQGVSRLG